MFGLFGRKPRSFEDELIPELRRHVVQIQESIGVSYLAIAGPMLTFGVSLQVNDKGLPGLAHAINTLSALIEEEQKASVGSLSSAVLDITIPEQPRDHLHSVVGKLGEFARQFLGRGYSCEEVGVAMIGVAGLIAKAIDKSNLLGIGLLRRELERRRDEYRREQFRHTASGERCTDDSINTLLEAERYGLKLSIERDGTIVLTEGSAGVHYLRSNSDIERFRRTLEDRRQEHEATSSPVDKLVEQGHNYVQQQKLDEAISAFSAALRIRPDSAEIYLQRGVAWSNSYYNRGKAPADLQRAIDDYSRSIELEPELAEAYFQRAGLWSKQGQTSKAIADYSKTIEKNHKASSAYFCRALLWQSTGESGRAKAIADFDGAIRTGDKWDQFMALLSRGDAHHGYGNYEVALADFNAAAAYHDRCPPGLYEKRAAVLLELGRLREAIADFGEAIAAASSLADPRFVANMYEQRGQCRLRLGDADLAKQDFERAAQLKAQKR